MVSMQVNFEYPVEEKLLAKLPALLDETWVVMTIDFLTGTYSTDDSLLKAIILQWANDG